MAGTQLSSRLQEPKTACNDTDRTRSYFHDAILGTKVWPKMYDGRAVVTDAYRDHVSGISLEENRAKFGAAKDAGDDSRQVTWA